ncbi:MAG: ATP-binding protein [Candidatus Woesearchaeota archaeon]
MYDIIIGRSDKDKEKLGTKGTILLGKHFVKMGRTTSLSNPVYMDMTRSHVVFVCGKRGGGKSYTLGVMAEGMAALEKAVKQNLSVIMLDTMGIYWTMKYPNKKDRSLLQEWGLEGEGLDVQIYTPTGYYKKYKEEGIPTDKPFSIRPAELSPNDWLMTFGIHEEDPVGVLIERVIHRLTEHHSNKYSMDDIMEALMADEDADQTTKLAAKNRFSNATKWGLFDEEGTPLSELAKGGQVTVLDVSCYATMPGSWNIKNLVIGLVSQKLFVQRMIARKDEEYHEVHKAINPYAEEGKGAQEYPLVWLVIDEAHEFLPVEGKTLASDPLVTILREGRQPGISLVLATQQPGKIHTDVMTQSDTVISHRITAKLDTQALGMLMQSYMRKGLVEELDQLPRLKGAAIIFDDTNERMYPIRVRPRFTWHGGEAPNAMKEEKDEIRL